MAGPLGIYAGEYISVDAVLIYINIHICIYINIYI